MWSIALIGRLALSPTGLTLVAKKIWLAQFQCDRQKIHQITLQVFGVFFSEAHSIWCDRLHKRFIRGKIWMKLLKTRCNIKEIQVLCACNSCGTQNNGLASRCVWGNPYSAQTEDFSLSKHPTRFQPSLVRKLLRWEKYKYWFMLLAQTHTLNVGLDESHVTRT